MNREVRQKPQYRPEPVQRIELDDRNPAVRLVVVIGLLMLGFFLIGKAVSDALTPASGWTEIEPASAEMNCSGDFVFLYDLGQSGMPISAEKKKLTILYSEACERAEKIFGTGESSGSALVSMNRHPNEDVPADEALLRALRDIETTESRYPYLAPVFEQYRTLFACASDNEASNYLPETAPELAEFYAELLPFVNDSGSIRLVLNGDGTVRLTVSEEYLSFARENGIEIFFDLFALKNAFVADYLAEEMIAAGFTRGVISSYDGFARCLDGSGESFSLNLYEQRNGRAVQTDERVYTGPMSIAVLRAFPVMEAKEYYWYRFGDGRVITALIDPQTGRFAPKRESILQMDPGKSCGALALEAYGEIA